MKTITTRVWGVSEDVDHLLAVGSHVYLHRPAEKPYKVEVWSMPSMTYIGRITKKVGKTLVDAAFSSVAIRHFERREDRTYILVVEIKYKPTAPRAKPPGWECRPCLGRKICHYSRASAEEHVRNLAGREKRRWWKSDIHIYWCIYCTAYHVGHEAINLPNSSIPYLERGGRVLEHAGAS